MPSGLGVPSGIREFHRSQMVVAPMSTSYSQPGKPLFMSTFRAVSK